MLLGKRSRNPSVSSVWPASDQCSLATYSFGSASVGEQPNRAALDQPPFSSPTGVHLGNIFSPCGLPAASLARNPPYLYADRSESDPKSRALASLGSSRNNDGVTSDMPALPMPTMSKKLRHEYLFGWEA